MRAVTFPRVVAALAVLVAAAAVLVARTPRIELPDTAISAEALPPREPAPPTAAALETAAGETPAAAAKLRELNAMSETFRNTTFLIAIRDAGLVCRELLGVYGGLNNSETWTASCSEMLAYTVRVASAGTLQIEPLLEHLDAVPRPVPNGPSRELLPPRDLPPNR